MTEGQIQGKWVRVYNKGEFERTEFILAGFICDKYYDYLSEWLDFFLQVVNAFATHMTGAIMVFGLGMVYCWIQAIISHKMRHQAMSSALSSCTRFILSGLVTVFFIISILSLRLRLAVGIANRPSLSYLVPMFQNESRAKPFKWNWHFHMNDCTWKPVLNRHRGQRQLVNGSLIYSEFPPYGHPVNTANSLLWPLYSGLNKSWVS